MMMFFKTVPQFDFMGRRKISYLLSGALLLGSLGLIFTGKARLSIDFTGGSLVEGFFESPVPLEDIRTALSASKVEADLQTAGEKSVIIRSSTGVKEEAATAITTALAKAFPGNPFTLSRAEYVGPVVGRHLIRESLLAILFSMLGIIVYVAFRFKNWTWGLTGVLALLHDVVITMGFLIVMGRDISVTVVAALLTLAGYSINDTIVIFDRIRESLRARRKEGLDALLNRSLNETLSRTLMTSMMVLFVLLALLFCGGEVLRDFSLALTFGVICGSYSTWFVATPLVYDWESRGRKPGAR